MKTAVLAQSGCFSRKLTVLTRKVCSLSGSEVPE